MAGAYRHQDKRITDKTDPVSFGSTTNGPTGWCQSVN